MDIEKLKREIQTIEDPRRQWGNIRHNLEDILIIGLCAVIAGGEDFEDMEIFGTTQKEWLTGFLELPNGIPDSDTFRRVYEKVDSNALAKSLNAWLARAESSGGRTVNIDGKTERGSGNDEHSAYHVVSAWVSENEITLGEIATNQKSNEITAIPELLDLIDIEGDIVTIDAMGCQTEIAEKIRDKEADYVLALKKNQGTLHEYVKEYFDWLDQEQPQEEWREKWESGLEKGHGRIENREIRVASASWLENAERWKDLCTIIRCRSTRIEKDEKTISDRLLYQQF